jgi:hypothetical protein
LEYRSDSQRIEGEGEGEGEEEEERDGVVKNLINGTGKNLSRKEQLQV